MSEQPQNFLTKKDKDSDYYMKKKRKNALEYERLIQKKKQKSTFNKPQITQQATIQKFLFVYENVQFQIKK
jgi:hypothetical protein